MGGGARGVLCGGVRFASDEAEYEEEYTYEYEEVEGEEEKVKPWYFFSKKHAKSEKF